MKDFLEVMQEGERLAEVRGADTRIEKFNEKLASLISLISNEKGYRTSMRHALLEEAAVTSEFPTLFGTILDRQLLAKYSIARPDWRSYLKVGTQMDFRPQQAIGVFGLQGGLNAVASRSEYKSDAKLAEGKVQISLTKYGRRFGLGWEIIINDDLGAFSDISERLANAALRTEYREATKLFCASTGPHASLFGAPIVHPIDGKNVINKFTGAGATFNVTNLGVACQKLRSMVDADGEPIFIEGFELVVPPALEIAMLTVLRSAMLIIAGGDTTAGTKGVPQGSANVVADLNITGHVNPYLPVIDTSGAGANADKTWYLFARLSSGAAAQLNFLRGHESPELVMKNPNKLNLGGGISNPLEGDFETDAIDWRVRHIMGGVQVDPRMAVANVGA